jgi:hypothetical protein
MGTRLEALTQEAQKIDLLKNVIPQPHGAHMTNEIPNQTPSMPHVSPGWGWGFPVTSALCIIHRKLAHTSLLASSIFYGSLDFSEHFPRRFTDPLYNVQIICRYILGLAMK